MISFLFQHFQKEMRIIHEADPDALINRALRIRYNAKKMKKSVSQRMRVMCVCVCVRVCVCIVPLCSLYIKAEKVVQTIPNA